MFKIVKCDGEVFDAVGLMLDELGEPQQILTVTSPRPLVVHRVMGQMTLVVRGAGLAQLAGEIVPLAEGDLLILAPGCEHSFAAIASEMHLRHWHWPQAMLLEDRNIVKDEADFGPALGEPETDARNP